MRMVYANSIHRIDWDVVNRGRGKRDRQSWKHIITASHSRGWRFPEALYYCFSSLPTRLAMAMMVQIGGLPGDFGSRVESAI